MIGYKSNKTKIMNYIKTDDPTHERVNLDEVLYYYSNDYTSPSIHFSVPRDSISWNFSNIKDRDIMLKKLDLVSGVQDISTVIKL